jgi:hypothetical protein
MAAQWQPLLRRGDHLLNCAAVLLGIHHGLLKALNGFMTWDENWGALHYAEPTPNNPMGAHVARG